MTSNKRTILTSIAFISLITGVISYLLGKYMFDASYVIRGSVMVFIVCVIMLKE